MQVTSKKILHHDIINHETKKRVLIKFLLVLLVFVTYFIVIARHYGLKDGLYVTMLSWSFFVLCTPIADAGFLLDFPIRIITRIRMMYSEIAVWIIAISLNLYTLFIHPEIYGKTTLLELFQHILEQPIPYWAIIILSGIGTFLSIRFGDELLDTIRHKDRTLYRAHHRKYKLITMVFTIGLAIAMYDVLLKQLGVALPL